MNTPDCPRCASPTLNEVGHPEIFFCYRCQQPYRLENGELVKQKGGTPEKQAQGQAGGVLPQGTDTQKFHARPTEAFGIKFASRAEERRYEVLSSMEMAGEITQLEVHPEYVFMVSGCRIGKYTADFRYQKDGELTVEDVKSAPTKTEAYGLRRRLMLACFGIRIKETQ